MTRVALAAAIVVALAGVAAAQPTTAAEHFETGRRLYNLKEYDAAIAEFKQAYLLQPEPEYLYNLGQAHRLKGDCDGAKDFFGKFLRAKPDSDARAKIEKLIAECKPAPATEPVVPGGDTGTTTGAGGTGDAAMPPPPPLDPDAGSGKRKAGLITLVGGGVLLAVGGGLAWKVSSTESDIEADCADGCDWDALAGRHDSAQTQSSLSKVSFVVGGAAVVAGAVLYFWGRSERPDPQLSLTPTAGGATLALTTTF
jgi:tetratricopeptide (TPR) repeat protein